MNTSKTAIRTFLFISLPSPNQDGSLFTRYRLQTHSFLLMPYFQYLPVKDAHPSGGIHTAGSDRRTFKP